MLTDRKEFVFRYPGTSVKPVSWVRNGEQRKSSRVNKPSVVNMYAGITKFGVTQPHLVTGTSKLATNYTSKGGAIENAWGCVSNKVDARGCETFDEYQAAVLEEWKKLDKAYLTKLIGSMKKRLQDCINAGGDKIGY